MFKFLTIFLLFFTSLFAEPVPANKAFDIKSSIGDNGVVIDFKLDKSVYIYKSSLKFEILDANAEITEILNLPQSEKYKEYEIYKNSFKILIPAGLIKENADFQNFSVKVEFSGCAFDGFCYPPQIFGYHFSKNLLGYKISKIDHKILNPKAKKSQIKNEHEKIAENIATSGILFTIFSFFGYGLLLSLTPCIFPMIPILSSILVAKKAKDSKSGSFLISFVYVFAMSLAYAIAGALASFFGANIQGLLQTPWVIIAFCVIFVALAFSMFGFYQISIPAKFQSFLNQKTQNKNGYFGVFVMGFLSALIVGPCVAPALAGALLYITQTQNVLYGSLALFALGFGSGVPLLFLGLGAKFLPKPGEWMSRVSKIFGFLLLTMAIWFLSRIIGENIALLLYGLLAFVFAGFLGIFEKSAHFLSRSFGLFVAIYAVLLLIGFASGSKDFLKPLDNFQISKNMKVKNGLNFSKISTITELENLVKTAKKPVLIDFTASWCAVCKELESSTFKNPSVVENFKNFELVKIDVSENSQNDLDLMKKFGVFGPPALVFYKNGVELKEFRNVGFIEASKLNEILQKIMIL